MRSPSLPKKGPHRYLVASFFVLLGILLYANTIGHQYALDDTLFITDNVYTKSGIRGIPAIFGHDSFQGFFQEQKSLVSGGRYRPLSIAMFALEYQVAGLTPALGHAINVLLYGLSGALLYLLLLRLLPPETKTRWWAAASFLITVLFMVHPLHTEVVANVKGRDEILALLLALSGFHAFLSYCERPARRGTLHLVGGTLLFLLALLAKETAIPFVVTIPLGIWFFRKVEPRRLATVFGALVFSAAIYFAGRTVFAGSMTIVKTVDLLNDPFALASMEERLATIFKTLGIYLRLFVFPHPLSHDYYYNQIPLTRFGDPASFLPALLALGLAVFAVLGWRSKDPIAFGLLFFAISFSIVSNVFFSIGTTMAERFLYIPSLGLALAAVFAVQGAFAKLMGKAGPRAAAVALLLVSVAFSAKTILRNPVWKDNLTLFSTDVQVSPNSAKVQGAMGGTLSAMAAEENDPVERARLTEEAVRHFRRAVEIYPEHSLAWFGLGNLLARERTEQAREAIECYRRVITLEPDKALAHRNLAVVAHQVGDTDTALRSIRRYRSLKPDAVEASLLEAGYLEKSGRADSAFAIYEGLIRSHPDSAEAWAGAGLFLAKHRRDYPRAVDYLSRAIALDSSKVSYYENLGSALILNGQHRAAAQTLEQARGRLGSTYLLEWNLGVAWRQLGDHARSEQHLARARQLGGSR